MDSPETAFKGVAFMDRDGTIIRDTEYPNDPAKVELLPTAGEAIRTLNREGIAVVVVSNQSGVARGRITPEQMAAVQARTVELLLAEGAHIDRAYFCTSSPDANDPRRKPGVGMFAEAQRDLPIDGLPRFMVGDKVSDLEFGLKIGARCAWVPTGEARPRDFERFEKTLAGGMFEGMVEKVADLRVFAEDVVAECLLRSAAGKGVMLDSFGSPEEVAATIRKTHAGARVVLANGCFDLLHGGHVSYLEDAAELGDLLVVAVNTDASMRRLKGPGRPVIPMEDRVRMLHAMEAVGLVTLITDDSAEYLLRTIRPHVHAKGTDYSAETVPEREVARELEITVAIAGAAKENSTKDIVRTVRRDA